MAPKGITVRKVRASQGRITDNVRRGRPQGKCNRDIPPPQGGKGGRAVQETTARPVTDGAYVNPIRSNAFGRAERSATVPAGIPMAAEGASPQAVWQQAAQIDDRGVLCTHRTRLTNPITKIQQENHLSGGSLVVMKCSLRERDMRFAREMSLRAVKCRGGPPAP